MHGMYIGMESTASQRNRSIQHCSSERAKKVSVVSTFSLFAVFLGIILSFVLLREPGGGGGKGGTSTGSGNGEFFGDGSGEGMAGEATVSTADISDSLDQPTQPVTPADVPEKTSPIVVHAVPTNFMLVDSTPARTPQASAVRGGRDAGGGGGSGGGTGTGQGEGVGETTFMGTRAEGRSFVYIVDCSGSMVGVKLEEAKAELRASVDRLQRQQRFFVFFYDNASYPMPGGQMVWGTRANRQACHTWAATMNSGGGTEPAESLLAAIKMRPDVIFFMSDGVFDDGVCDQIKQAQGNKLSIIHTVSFVDRTGESVMRRIAEENGGQYIFNPGRLSRRP